MSEIASRVKAIIVDKLGVDENEVTETAEFTKDLGADSITIPDDQAEKISTVQNAIEYIEANTQK